MQLNLFREDVRVAKHIPRMGDLHVDEFKT